MTEKQTILTAEGLEKLKAELNELRTVKRLETKNVCTKPFPTAT